MLIAEQQADILYGGSSSNRWHLEVGPREAVADDVLAYELLELGTVPEGTETSAALFAVHVCSERKRLGKLSQAVFSHGETWTPPSPDWVTLNSSSPLRAVHFVPAETDGAGSDATPLAYAAITMSAEVTDDLCARAQQHVLTIARPDWSALILRDGGAFVAHQSSAENFTDSLRVHVHSLHLDALLLAWAQRILLDRSDVGATRASIDDPFDLVALERAHFEFKRTYWRRSLTSKRTSPTDDIFRAFQDELLTPRDIADVEDRVQQGARLARTLHAERLEQAQERLASLVRNAAVVIGSFSLVFTAAPVLAPPGWGAFIVAFGIGCLGVIASFAFLHLADRRHARARREHTAVGGRRMAGLRGMQQSRGRDIAR